MRLLGLIKDKKERRESISFGKASIRGAVVGIFSLGKYRTNYTAAALGLDTKEYVYTHDSWGFLSKECKHNINVYRVESIARLVDGLVALLTVGYVISHLTAFVTFSSWASKYR